MKKIVFFIFLISLFISPLSTTAAQETDDESTVTFDVSGIPQWGKDLRRFDIVAFGTFPFSMLFANFFYDLYRWNNANGMDFSAEGRRYAPWPFQSAGGIEKTTQEYKRTIFIAASLSVVLAVTDLIIVKTKQKKENRRLQSLPPSGSFSITRSPVVTDEEEEFVPDIDDGSPLE